MGVIEIRCYEVQIVWDYNRDGNIQLCELCREFLDQTTTLFPRIHLLRVEENPVAAINTVVDSNDVCPVFARFVQRP